MSNKVMTPAIYGNGYCYYVEVPGSEDAQILADTRDLETLVNESAQRGFYMFRGIEVDGQLADGSEVKMLVGAGVVHTSPESGAVIRYHDHFQGPPNASASDEDGDDEKPPQRPEPSRPQGRSSPSPFPALR